MKTPAQPKRPSWARRHPDLMVALIVAAIVGSALFFAAVDPEAR